MSRGINKVILIGNLGSDPKVNSFGEGNCRCTFSLATGYSYKDRATEQVKQETEWHNIVLFNRLAEIAMQYIKKGSKIYLEGYLKTSKWVDANNIERKKTEIITNNLQILDSRNTDRTNVDSNINTTQSNSNLNNKYNDLNNEQDPSELPKNSKNIIDDIPF